MEGHHLSLSLPQPSHRASSLPQSPINLPVKQILGLTSCAPVVRFIQPPAARKSAETIFKARRGGGGGGTAAEEGWPRRKKRGWESGESGRREGEGDELHFIAENSRGIGEEESRGEVAV